tara:strand:- start:296 stop:499 length:204 start_codon:yes stop_codon:yes gene_type:complete
MKQTDDILIGCGEEFYVKCGGGSFKREVIYKVGNSQDDAYYSKKELTCGKNDEMKFVYKCEAIEVLS